MLQAFILHDLFLENGIVELEKPDFHNENIQTPMCGFIIHGIWFPHTTYGAKFLNKEKTRLVLQCQTLV